MMQLDNLAGERLRKTSHPPGTGNCLALEALTKTRGEAFTEYLTARHHLSVCSGAEAAGHTAAVETFEAARRKWRASQRKWEQHVAAYHMG